MDNLPSGMIIFKLVFAQYLRIAFNIPQSSIFVTKNWQSREADLDVAKKASFPIYSVLHFIFLMKRKEYVIISIAFCSCVNYRLVQMFKRSFAVTQQFGGNNIVQRTFLHD